jgi:GTP-binding protein Era
LAPRESQKRIVVGAGGATIGSVGAEAERELAAMWGVAVQLDLVVKVGTPR